MNEKVFFVVAWICKLIITKRHVSHRQIEAVVSKIHTLKPIYCDMNVGIKLLCDPACDGIQFYTIKRSLLHLLRQKSEEIAHAHGRLQNGFRL